MTTTNFRGNNISGVVSRIRLQRGLAFGVIIISALLAFEIFNYSTTEFALADLRGPVDHDQLESIHFIPELAHAFMACPGCESPDFEVLEGRGVWIECVEGR